MEEFEKRMGRGRKRRKKFDQEEEETVTLFQQYRNIIMMSVTAVVLAVFAYYLMLQWCAIRFLYQALIKRKISISVIPYIITYWSVPTQNICHCWVWLFTNREITLYWFCIINICAFTIFIFFSTNCWISIENRILEKNIHNVRNLYTWFFCTYLRKKLSVSIYYLLSDQLFQTMNLKWRGFKLLSNMYFYIVNSTLVQ